MFRKSLPAVRKQRPKAGFAMAQFNFRLFLRATAIGKAIIDRLSAEGCDRQADARRWIELGYALEQTGFRLDGTTVYLGGRAFAPELAMAQVSAQGASAAYQAVSSPLPETQLAPAAAPAEEVKTTQPQAGHTVPTNPTEAATAVAPLNSVSAPLVSTTPAAGPRDDMAANLANLSL